jgi:hypothetical protein
MGTRGRARGRCGSAPRRCRRRARSFRSSRAIGGAVVCGVAVRLDGAVAHVSRGGVDLGSYTLVLGAAGVLVHHVGGARLPKGTTWKAARDAARAALVGRAEALLAYGGREAA